MSASAAIVSTLRSTNARREIEAREGAWPVWAGYLAAIAVAELVVSAFSVQVGIGLHLALLLLLPLHASFAPGRQRPLLLALVLAPLVRVVSLALPLAATPPITWYLLTSLPLFVAAGQLIRVLGQSRQQLGLRLGNPRVQLAIALLGVPLGITEYFILRPHHLVDELSLATILLPALVLLVSTGLLEELIFRGILQTAAGSAIGRWGTVYVSGVFAVLHIGYLSALDVVFVFAVALLFSWLVARTGSILGVTLAHGLTNLLLLVVLPMLSAQLSFGQLEPAEPPRTSESQPAGRLRVDVLPMWVLPPAEGEWKSSLNLEKGGVLG